MSAQTSPSKQLASRFAHLAYSPVKSKHALSRSSSTGSIKRLDRLGSDVDSDDLDGEDPHIDERHLFADHDLRPVQVKHELELDLQPAKGQASPYFPASLKRKSPSSPLTSPPSSDAPSPKKKSSVPIARKYAHPSVYADGHPVLTDLMAHNADCMFVGINPGLSSAKKGHHYAGATNRFWKCLYQSGFTPRVLSPTEDHTLPTEHSICMTNLVPRPTASASELSAALDLRPNVSLLLSKISTYRPRVVCFVGKDIWKEVEFVLKKAHPPAAIKKGGKGKGKEKGKMVAGEGNGWEGPRAWKMVHAVEDGSDGVDESKEEKDERVLETYFWVVSSTSGLVRDSMETRLTTQWVPLLTFIRDLKAGVKPWLPAVPPHPAPEFKIIEIGAVETVVQAIVKKNAEKGDKEEGLVKMEVDEDDDEVRVGDDGGEPGKGGWRVVEVWEPGKAGVAKVEDGDGG